MQPQLLAFKTFRVVFSHDENVSQFGETLQWKMFYTWHDPIVMWYIWVKRLLEQEKMLDGTWFGDIGNWLDHCLWFAIGEWQVVPTSL